MFGTTRRTAAFLDGGFVSRDPPYFLGLRGIWIIGYSALRYLCAEYDLQQPRRFKHEKYAPSPDELRSRLADQLKNERPMLEARARLLEYGEGDEIREQAAALAAQDFWPVK